MSEMSARASRRAFCLGSCTMNGFTGRNGPVGRLPGVLTLPAGAAGATGAAGGAAARGAGGAGGRRARLTQPAGAGAPEAPGARGLGAPRARVARESVWARLGLMLPPAMPVAPAQGRAAGGGGGGAGGGGGGGGRGGAQTAMQVERWVRAAEPLRVAARSL